MRYSTRIRARKMTLITIAIIAFVILNILLFKTVLDKSKSIEKSVTQIASGENISAYTYDDGVIIISGTQVSCYDYNGVLLYTAEAPREDMEAYRNGDYTILWHTNLVCILDEDGEEEWQQDLGEESEAVIGTCNDSQFAVAVMEEDQSKIKVYDYSGDEVWINLYPDMTIIDIGYFDDDDSQIWTLTLDYHGTTPITRVYTNYPGSSQTGRITINDQICYEVVPYDDYVYIVGTQHIQSRTYTDTKLTEILINGWSLQSNYTNEDDEASFLLAPVDTTGNDVALSSLWYITDGGEQYRISMPAGILKATLTDRKIYAISEDGVYYMNFNGQKRNFSKLSFTIDEVVGICTGKSAVVRSGVDYYIIGLNK